MQHPLDGARERLKRADENIHNLDIEVNAFLSTWPRVKFPYDGKNIIVSDENRKAFEELRKGVLARTTLPRLSVLAGEIVHHLRSAFDHVIWQLSSLEARSKFPQDIEFPVCELRTPPECIWRRSDHKVKHSSYCRKVKGVSSPIALARIDSLQAYHRTDFYNSPLLKIHILDKFDKHRELVDVTPQAKGRAIRHTSRLVNTVKDSASGGMRVVGLAGPSKVKVYAEMSADVAFIQLREWESESLIPLLKNLLRFASDAVESFASEF